ncbi:MAG: large conductance mechanosensitive channel protein MscL [Bacteroidia bacterium]|nr:large conductance mechanosensitive channel protein MscL [Bacteroidia bacterium]
MAILKEFKDFALKGNVIDLAVGVVIGGAFNSIVGSLVNDIITPAVLNPALKAANLTNLADLTIPGTAVKYGNFLSTCISFVIVAFSLFIVVKGINAAKKRTEQEEKAAPPPPPEPTTQEKLLAEIRDLLKK